MGTQVEEGILGNPRLGRQFVQSRESRTRRHEMGLRVFPFEGAVRFEAEQPDDGPQAQPLPDQRHQDDREGEEDHQVALREEACHR